MVLSSTDYSATFTIGARSRNREAEGGESDGVEDDGDEGDASDGDGDQVATVIAALVLEVYGENVP